MKRILKWAGILFLLGILGIGIFLYSTSENEPVGNNSKEADVLANKMMEAVNKEAWDNTRYLQWTFFRGEHHYFWDKANDMVEVVWGKNKVLLHTKTLTGKAYTNDELIEDKEASQKLLDDAWSYFCNDGFWLNPVVKAFDSGTERSIVTLDDGREGLKVTYKGGGVTPGDSYVWVLDENNLPQEWKMWVKIIPVGGVSTTWENWTKLSTGALVAIDHKMGGTIDASLSNVKGGNSLSDFGREGDPFLAIGN